MTLASAFSQKSLKAQVSLAAVGIFFFLWHVFAFRFLGHGAHLGKEGPVSSGKEWIIY